MRVVSPALLSLAAAACAGDDGHGHDDAEVNCATVTDADVFVVGLEKQGQDGALNFRLMSADPAPPARGDNTWVVEVSTLDNGAVGTPVDGAQLTVTPFMPAHQHGSPIQTVVTATGTPGQYTLAPVNLWMPGVWETTIRATAGATTDSTIYRFCID